MVQIKSFGVLQTAKFAAAMYFIFTAVVMLPIGFLFLMLGSMLGMKQGPFGALGPLVGGALLVILPLVYAAAGFIFVALTCLIYNVVAKYVGGIEIELEQLDSYSDYGEEDERLSA